MELKHSQNHIFNDDVRISEGISREALQDFELAVKDANFVDMALMSVQQKYKEDRALRKGDAIEELYLDQPVRQCGAMLCLRCGRCCIYLDIFIVNPSSILPDGSINPGESETMVFAPAGQMCPHLRFTDMQNYQGRDRLNAKSDGPSHSAGGRARHLHHPPPALLPGYSCHS